MAPARAQLTLSVPFTMDWDTATSGPGHGRGHGGLVPGPGGEVSPGPQGEERAGLGSVKVRPGGLLRVTRTLTQTGSHSREIGNILMERDN